MLQALIQVIFSPGSETYRAVTYTEGEARAIADHFLVEHGSDGWICETTLSTSDTYCLLIYRVKDATFASQTLATDAQDVR
jgi:hypothetical protein